MNAVLELPEIHDRHAFNLARWKEIADSPALAQVEGRIESDAYGNIMMLPPPGFSHSNYQGIILHNLRRAGGMALPECPVSTLKGIRGIVVVWISHARRDRGLRDNVLVIAPEICVEVLSPGNTRAEMEEKRELLFEAGAEEVWFCDKRGRIFFYLKEEPVKPAVRSRLCPDFPEQVS